MNQHCYDENQLVYISLNKANNLKDFIIKDFKPKVQEHKPISNYFGNTETFDKI